MFITDLHKLKPGAGWLHSPPQTSSTRERAQVATGGRRGETAEGMVGKKKGVPEWLNSPLWSSNLSDDRRSSRYETRTLSPEPSSPPPAPSRPEPSPSRPRLAVAQRSEIGAHSGELSPSWSSLEEESRESQLLADFQITVRVLSHGCAVILFLSYFPLGFN